MASHEDTAAATARKKAATIYRLIALAADVGNGFVQA